MGSIFDATTWCIEKSEDASKNNYEHSKAVVLNVAMMCGSEIKIIRPTCVPSDHWPVVMRLMIMDNPALSHFLTPSYSREIDCQLGISQLMLAFRAATCRRPLLRNWMSAPGIDMKETKA